ncbi:MAG: hypothetical protein N2043_01495 [Ignavibacterium sp.]|nr:hypothetical protein [Ignavibacterium sp.]
MFNDNSQQNKTQEIKNLEERISMLENAIKDAIIRIESNENPKFIKFRLNCALKKDELK